MVINHGFVYLQSMEIPVSFTRHFKKKHPLQDWQLQEYVINITTTSTQDWSGTEALVHISQGIIGQYARKRKLSDNLTDLVCPPSYAEEPDYIN